jgi:8-oxo-dGTP pyrophosphatase MutT (NUDIX family)
MGYKLVSIYGGNNNLKIIPNGFDRKMMKNVAVYYVKDGKLLLLVTNVPDRGRPLFTGIGVPGGGLDKMDAKVFDGMKREWREEMGADLPRLDFTNNVKRYAWKDTTAIYIVKGLPGVQVPYNHNRVHKFKHDPTLPETLAAEFKELDVVKSVLERNGKLEMNVNNKLQPYSFRPAVRESTLAVIAELRRLGWDK